MNIREVQGELWSVAPRQWSTQFEPFFIPLYKVVLRQLHIAEDTLLLDAGCGSGLFSAMAIDAGAQVIGIDAAPGLLAIARERNPYNNFLEADLEALPFADRSFDLVIGFNSFQYASNVAKALREARRVLKDRGKLVIAVWDKPARSEATEILKAIQALLPSPAADAPPSFSLADDQAMEAWIELVGARLLFKSTVTCPMFFQTIDNAVDAFMSTAPAAAACRHQFESNVRQTIQQAMEMHAATAEFYHLQNQFIIFVAERG